MIEEEFGAAVAAAATEDDEEEPTVAELIEELREYGKVLKPIGGDDALNEWCDELEGALKNGRG